ncbi:hypothetical protein D5041_03335 [Verminephrobacter aporrectodeae subsp. tuberculatae]|uniref:RES domain-containing protein n=1 Tax=Verminephrobacter aporrectodeae subsp. tuberculatae TaxID=1110392 RepID=A0ABT3KV66_9BURK|nr:RES domain-containing protein [Verminephrobacter aporrectodeae]MCW5222664.1 hypothetical protein [Verminephrobacter aporrectodeae subsp. tuberculatae]MCW5257103.1 hypothetical protein [Verminephrobacter aporrectodeae subsp. tuberculatae]MCW5288128.1 hypothetical protein [Verminephrobacter aporrectodeae subsp. tuberculatae]MCW5321695.1 hypothetical protein [Verminephrobacter aporrectodeae subsp. tuberculatae]MCW8164245.1 hypothetical protein [Verminephrobacter aporrectodeae subsp. tuberculat
MHGSDYTDTHAVAAGAQDRGVQWLSCESVRAPAAHCAVVFDPDGLRESPEGLEQTMQTWHCKATRSGVMFTRGRESYDWAF